MLLGIDIVDIARIEQISGRTPHFFKRVFTSQELAYCMKKANPYPSLAVRYAAKEAVRKLDEIFVSGIHFHDVEVMVEDRGKPFILLHGKALEKATGAGIRDLTVSLSHSNAQAVAVVCANRG